MRAPVDSNLAAVQPVTPFAERIGRQTQRSGVFAHAHSAPFHRLDVHSPERLNCSRLRVGAHAKAPPLASFQSFFSLLATLLAAYPWAGKEITIGFTGTYSDDGAEFDATALAGKRSFNSNQSTSCFSRTS